LRGRLLANDVLKLIDNFHFALQKHSQGLRRGPLLLVASDTATADAADAAPAAAATATSTNAAVVVVVIVVIVVVGVVIVVGTAAAAAAAAAAVVVVVVVGQDSLHAGPDLRGIPKVEVRRCVVPGPGDHGHYVVAALDVLLGYESRDVLRPRQHVTRQRADEVAVAVDAWPLHRVAFVQLVEAWGRRVKGAILLLGLGPFLYYAIE
jgi:hypothetical protein